MDYFHLLIGIVVGMMLMLLLVLILYQQRALAFSSCPQETRMCMGKDYFNNPADALAHGASLEEFLHQDEEGSLHYKRHRRQGECSPGPDQTVKIDYPQFCTFSTEKETLIGVAATYGVPLYNLPQGIGTIETGKHCQPLPGSSMVTGKPLKNWISSGVPID